METAAQAQAERRPWRRWSALRQAPVVWVALMLAGCAETPAPGGSNESLAVASAAAHAWNSGAWLVHVEGFEGRPFDPCMPSQATAFGIVPEGVHQAVGDGTARLWAFTFSPILPGEHEGRTFVFQDGLVVNERPERTRPEGRYIKEPFDSVEAAHKLTSDFAEDAVCAYYEGRLDGSWEFTVRTANGTAQFGQVWPW